eukprot:TRINITY_DN48993_c0_g1_i1.p1 TRINITY_DN48993_c0_g1~~TRINITY_DN48993_c0_g1_i1.p1  ORF type:complete len:315 (+),score=62.57 TRINITY_DN48993_c0_g1_i1:35-979(+)
MRRVVQSGAETVGRRCVRYMPEYEMRRPEASSVMYRAVQDWKPIAHEVAHTAGKELPENEKCVTMHMVLIDRQGFRWPIRFNLAAGMTLYDLFAKTDVKWFDVLPNNASDRWRSRHSDPNREADYFFKFYPEPCQMDNPNMHKCARCFCLVPYEYLDAMSPPSMWEVDHLRRQVWFGRTPGAGNMRVACQVYVEEWMDGMTIVLPQEESYAYQMYYSQGVDKGSVDAMMGRSFSGVTNNSAGHLTPKKDTDPLSIQEQEQNWELQYDRGDPVSTPFSFRGDNVPLRDIFWTDSIDDVIRAKHPKWRGYYEFLNK